MNIRTALIAILGLSLSALFAQQTVQLSGTVKDAGSQAGIEGATVSLSAAGLSATTDAQGSFTLTGTVPVLKNGALSGPEFTGTGSIVFELDAFKTVSVTVRSLKGTVLLRTEEQLTSGHHMLTMPVSKPGFLLVELSLGDRTYHLKQLNLITNSEVKPVFIKTAPPASITRLKRSQRVDTLNATHPSYVSGSTPVTSYESSEIELNLVAKTGYGLKDTLLQLPDPDNEDYTGAGKPLKVFIQYGQSNMIGYGEIEPKETAGTLLHYVENENKYPHTVDDQGEWTKRNDVYDINVISGKARNWHTAGFGNGSGRIGPEFQFGHIMGFIHDEPVLLIKASIGNRALGWDLCPPSMSLFPKEVHENQWYQGYELDNFIEATHGALNDLPGEYQTYVEDNGIEIAGFTWFQGHKDQSTVASAAELGVNYPDGYEEKLVALIKDLRIEFEAPDAKFVIATVGFGGWGMDDEGLLKVLNAQLAINDTQKYPEFEGNAMTVESRGYWRDAAESPENVDYHYNHNAETYYLVGNALGWAMAELLND